jgi:hypothetical protein
MPYDIPERSPLHVRESDLAKDAQVSIRISGRMEAWLARTAGRKRSKADVIRSMIEAEMDREARARLTEMFDAAAAEMTEEDRGDRELATGAFADDE